MPRATKKLVVLDLRMRAFNALYSGLCRPRYSHFNSAGQYCITEEGRKVANELRLGIRG